MVGTDGGGVPLPMTSRERLLTALNKEEPDHLPATVHSWMEYFLNRYLGGVDQYEAYEITGLDMVISTQG